LKSVKSVGQICILQSKPEITVWRPQLLQSNGSNKFTECGSVLGFGITKVKEKGKRKFATKP